MMVYCRVVLSRGFCEMNVMSQGRFLHISFCLTLCFFSQYDNNSFILLYGAPHCEIYRIYTIYIINKVIEANKRTRQKISCLQNNNNKKNHPTIATKINKLFKISKKKRILAMNC